MEIHVKMLKFEDFCGNFHRYKGRHTNKTIIWFKRKWRHFLINLKKFVQHISDKMMEIHRKTLKFEDFWGNFHRYSDRHTNTIRI